MGSPVYESEEDGTVRVKPALIYPRYLHVIGNTGVVTQGALETARFVFTEDLKRVVGEYLHLVIERDDNFKLSKFPPGEVRRLDIGSAYDALPGTPESRLGVANGGNSDRLDQ